MRAALLLSLAAVAPLAAQSAPNSKRTVELTGTVLVNGFFNSARVNNSDVPQFADSLPAAGAGGGAIRAATSGRAQGLFAPQPGAAERSRRPYVQSRVRLGWGPTDDPNEIAIGGHQGWLASGDSLFQSQAVTVDTRVKLGVVELIGEGFVGKALAGLGGGGIGQSLGPPPLGVPVRTKGGWGQLNIRLRPEVMFGGGCGIDDPDDRDLEDVLGNPQGRLKNFVCEGHVELRPTGPLLFALEFRRLKTTYPSGDFAAHHLNAAAGYRF